MSDLRRKHREAYEETRRFARACALQILYQLDMGQWEDVNQVLERYWLQIDDDDELRSGHEPAAVRTFVDRLVTGVAAKRETLDQQLETYARHWTLARMNLVDRNILRLAAFEVLYCEDIPPKASVNEAIELAKRFGDKDSPKFVNGIIDNFLQQLDKQA